MKTVRFMCITMAVFLFLAGGLAMATTKAPPEGATWVVKLIPVEGNKLKVEANFPFQYIHAYYRGGDKYLNPSDLVDLSLGQRLNLVFKRNMANAKLTVWLYIPHPQVKVEGGVINTRVDDPNWPGAAIQYLPGGHGQTVDMEIK